MRRIEPSIRQPSLPHSPILSSVKSDSDNSNSQHSADSQDTQLITGIVAQTRSATTAHSMATNNTSDEPPTVDFFVIPSGGEMPGASALKSLARLEDDNAQEWKSGLR
ncbi:hypothetical protein CROQUDRAFT_110077 [Cronartium quercuum f. sp. fusiforme G11]|uniref:Uncharacterized protein n=1 Tax=Cronartium quercuum f. sp. fusiforme G11 TaxID=708437 RepID=A0A9P6NE85_9BASI|nr:hypothetical protein CROQUDRAFT_110077 [Cronartium quercuum f. sp. fusiforme G11]